MRTLYKPKKVGTELLITLAALAVIVIVAVSAFRTYVSLQPKADSSPIIVPVDSPTEPENSFLYKAGGAIGCFIESVLCGFSSAEAAEVDKGKGCMSKTEIQNVEVVISHEILSADNDVSLRAKIFEARSIMDDLRSRHENCKDENSRGHMRNAIGKIENAIAKASEAAEDKVELSNSQERYKALKRFELEKAKLRPSFSMIETMVREYIQLPDTSMEVKTQMERAIRGKGEEIGRDVMTKLNGYIGKKDTSRAIEEYNYMVKNASYLYVMDSRIPKDDFNYYKKQIIKIGGKEEQLANKEEKAADMPVKTDIPEGLQDISASDVEELAKSLREESTEPVKIIENGETNVMDDLKDLGVEDTTEQSKPASSFDDMMKSAVEKKKATAEEQ